MKLMSWNIQWGVGVVPANNRTVNLEAIAAVIRQVNADVVCLQEVCRFFPANTGAEDDQREQLAALLPGYESVFGPATDYLGSGGRRRQFGNLTLTMKKHDVLMVRLHSLPMPRDDAANKPSARGAIETVLRVLGGGVIGIVNTHLEYGSLPQRRQQLNALAVLLAQRADDAEAGKGRMTDVFPPLDDPFTPVTPAPTSDKWLLLGDFNCPSNNPELACLAEAGFRDAWNCLAVSRAPQPTLGVHVCPPGMSPQSFDRAYLSAALASRLRRCEVLADVTASDHQPLILEFE